MKKILISTTTLLAALFCYSSLTFAALQPVQGKVVLNIQNQTHGELTVIKTTLINLTSSSAFGPGTTIVNPVYVPLTQKIEGTDNTSVSFKLESNQHGTCIFTVQLVNGKWTLNPIDCSGDLLHSQATVQSDSLDYGLVRFKIKSLV